MDLEEALGGVLARDDEGLNEGAHSGDRCGEVDSTKRSHGMTSTGLDHKPTPGGSGKGEGHLGHHLGLQIWKIR